MSCIYLVQIRIPPTPPKFFCLSDNEDYKYRSLTFVPTANPIDLGGSCLGSECKAPEAEALCCAAAGAASAVGSGLFLRAACVSKGRGAARSRAPHPLFQHCCNSASLFKMQSPNRRCSIRNAAVLWCDLRHVVSGRLILGRICLFFFKSVSFSVTFQRPKLLRLKQEQQAVSSSDLGVTGAMLRSNRNRSKQEQPEGCNYGWVYFHY